MNTTKHTPGPWGVRKTASGNPFIYAGHLNVAGVAIARPGIDSATSAANARLIAAAPELLACLIAVRDAEVEGMAHIDIDAAIAKATVGAA